MENINPIKEQLQKDALDKFEEHYYKKENTRGILCACCGYGKSYLIYKILKKCIEKGEGLFIIATSRIKLLEQLGPDIVKWNKNEKKNIKFEVSLLCSEDIFKNPKKKYQNKLNISENEIISKITKRKNDTVNIFLTTYNSASKLVEKISMYNKALENNDELSSDIEPDLIILDEAHNTVGTGKSNNNEKFHHELFKTNDYFSSSKYLFMTATPLILKHKNPNSKINTEETLYSMNKENIYGKIFYYYSFAQGIKDKIITNFQTIHLKQNKEFIEKDNNKENFEKDRRNVLKLSKNEQQELYFRDISTLLIESMIKYGFEKTIIYIGNKDKAEIFKNILEKIKSKINFEIYKIVSDMTNGVRTQEEKNFIKSKRAVLIAVNIYNEGVDIPCVDSVMFAEERNSQTTIIQNIGRCLRLDEKKPNKIAFVIIPNILYEIAGTENNEFFASKFINIRKCIKIIKEKTEKLFFEKYTDNKKNINDDDISIDSIDEKIEIENTGDTSDNIIDNNIEQSEKQKYQIQLLKYYSINGTFDGFVSNRTLEDIKKKYLIDGKCTDLEKYKKCLIENGDDHILRTDIQYKNEWISWDYFFNDKIISYNDCKENIKEIQSFIKINDMEDLFLFYNFVIDYELGIREYYEYYGYYEFNLSEKMDIIKKKNKSYYEKILNNVLKIPYEPKKFFTSSNEWISVQDFLNLQDKKIDINNGSGSKESVQIDKNITNILNNDDNRIKQGRYRFFEDIDIPISIINYLQKEKLFNEKIKLCIRVKLTKKELYDSGEILIMNSDNKNIFGKIILNEYRLEYDKNLLLNLNIPKEKIFFDMKLLLDNIYEEDIKNLISTIKNKIKKNELTNIETNIEILESLKRKNNIIVIDDNDINNKKYTFSDNKIENYNFSQQNDKIEKVIKKCTDSKDNFEKNKLSIEIQKRYPNYGKVWIENDKVQLKKFVNDNVDLSNIKKKLGRNEGGILSQIKTMVNEGSIKKNDLNDDIYNKIY